MRFDINVEYKFFEEDYNEKLKIEEMKPNQTKTISLLF